MKVEAELVKQLDNFPQTYFSLTNLRVFFGKKKSALKPLVSRLVKSGILVRVTSSYYRLFSKPWNIENLATNLYYPCYLSLEKVVGDTGILNQKAYTYTFVTTRKTKKMTIEGQAVEFRQIIPDLFFGYFDAKGYYLAYPEKAFLDCLYFMSLGKGYLDFEELNLKLLQKKRLFSFLKKYPLRVKKLFEKKARPILNEISVTIQ